jgi:hypothetical protein
MQGISRVMMSPTELKMQPTIHLQSKPRYGRGQYTFNSVNYKLSSLSLPSLTMFRFIGLSIRNCNHI